MGSTSTITAVSGIFFWRRNLGAARALPRAGAVRGFQHELEAVVAAETGEGSGGGAENFHALLFEGSEAGGEGARPADGVFHFAIAHQNGGQRSERRIVQQAAEVGFLVEEGNVILLRGELDGVMLGVISFDEHFAGELTASGAARDLREQLEGALGGAKIGAAEGEIGGDHSDSVTR